MPEHIRKIFIANNYIVNYRITSNGYFEARIRRKGMYIEASGRDFETMRKRFMDRLATFYAYAQPTVTAEPAISSTPTANTILFGDYGREWLKIKEQTTKPSTFKEYERSFRVDLEPTFGKKPLADITRNDLQNYLFGIVGENKHRKAEKLALMRGKARQLLQVAQGSRRYGRFAGTSLFRSAKIRTQNHTSLRRKVAAMRNEQGTAGAKCRASEDSVHTSSEKDTPLYRL